MSTLKGFEYKNGKWTYCGFTKKKGKLKGRKNETINPRFVELCKFDKDELKVYLENELSKYYEEVISEDGFLYVKGTEKVCLTAHMDTTKNVEYGERQLVKDVYEYVEDGKHVVHSPQGIGGDDRCGVYMILKVLETTDLRPSIIFCEDEEIGCVGSSKFAKTTYVDNLDVNLIVQLDRRGSNDAVFYDDINEEFHAWVEEKTGYKEAMGSCSDISVICPECGISGVNLSCGYYNEHHDYETVKLEEMERTFEAAVTLIREGNMLEEPFKYKEEERYWGNYGGYNYGGYGSGYSYSGYKYGNTFGDLGLYITFNDVNGRTSEEYYDSLESEAEGWWSFFLDHPNTCFNDVLDYEVYDLNEM